MMRRISMLSIAMTLTASTTSANAQTVDAARMTAGIMVGKSGGAMLWSVAAQPVASVTTAPDTFALRRDLGEGITVSGAFTYFPSAHIGFTGEFSYLGVMATDQCTLVAHHGDRTLAATCDSVAQTYNHTRATTHVQGGVVYRPFINLPLQPYVKATGGVAFVPASTVALSSAYWHQPPKGQINPVEVDSVVTIYPDPTWRPIRSSAELAAGFVTAPVFGIEVKVEARESWLLLTQVTGPTPYQGVTPPTRAAFSRFISVLAGFDVVFARRRGRRY